MTKNEWLPRNAAFKLGRPHILAWQIGCEAFFFFFFTTDAHIVKITFAKLPPWPARGTWRDPAPLRRSIKANLSRTMQIMTNSIILRYAPYSPAHPPLISLIRESRGGSRCFGWGACCLIEWCWNRKNPQPPTNPAPCPAVTTSSLLSFHIFPPSAAAVHGCGW